jgi:hypothetical protein
VGIEQGEPQTCHHADQHRDQPGDQVRLAGHRDRECQELMLRVEHRAEQQGAEQPGQSAAQERAGRAVRRPGAMLRQQRRQH